MGGFFGAVSRKNCKYDVFFGTDYHSHLGTKRGGLAFYDPENGFQRQIHNIENTPFRTKFEKDLVKFHGNMGQTGCVSYLFSDVGEIVINNEDGDVDEDKLPSAAFGPIVSYVLVNTLLDFDERDDFMRIYESQVCTLLNGPMNSVYETEG